MSFYRSSGILLHPTSLPGNQGIGTLGKEAFQWIDWLAQSEQRLWQILPFGPTEADGSPYSSVSAFAGNPLWIDLELLADKGWLTQAQLENFCSQVSSSQRIDYSVISPEKMAILWKAFKQMRATDTEPKGLTDFVRDNDYWLEEYALFMSLADENNTLDWTKWTCAVHNRTKQYLGDKNIASDISLRILERKKFHIFTQYIFTEQWLNLRNYAKANRVRIIGDIPIYVSYHSADVWGNQDLFQLNGDGTPKAVAGVPPDYFSITGQKWGNPLYDWDSMRLHGFQWWRLRYTHLLKYIDIARIDHFRGLQAYWSIPFGDETAENGNWEIGPGTELLNALLEEDSKGSKIPDWESPLSIIAEDLGFITPPVVKVKESMSLPGMAILQFGLEGDQNFLPENIHPNTVAYTGTHDNNTTIGWFDDCKESGLDENITQSLKRYSCDQMASISWQLIDLTWRSAARIAIAPLQDILSLDSTHRMNVPGSGSGNWNWRVKAELMTTDIGDQLRNLSLHTGRSW